jgi:hypothetical protein
MRVILLAAALLFAMNPLQAGFLHKSGPKAVKQKRNSYNGRKNTHKAPRRPKVVHAN